MSRIFIDLYLDEDVDVLVAALLRSRGFAVSTTRDAHRLGTTDEEQLAYAATHEKTILTHNRVDFESLVRHYFILQKPHAGIIIAVRHPPHEVARRLLLILNQVTADEMKDQVRYI